MLKLGDVHLWFESRNGDEWCIKAHSNKWCHSVDMFRTFGYEALIAIAKELTFAKQYLGA